MATDALMVIPEPPPVVEPEKPKRPSLLAFLLSRSTLTPKEKMEAEAQRIERKRLEMRKAQLLAECDACATQISQTLADLDVCHRKSEKGKEKIKAVKFRRNLFQAGEDLLALPVDLGPRHRPRGVKVDVLADPGTLNDLSVAIGRRVECRYTPESGCVYFVYRAEGARGIPLHVKYDDMVALRPSSAGRLSFPLGMTEGRRPVWMSFEDCPSILICGTTGGGKSNQENVVVATLVNQNTPAQLKLCLIDFKRVELSYYRDLPHVVTFNYKGEEEFEAKERKAFATELEDAVPMMKWLRNELDRRTRLFEAERVKKIGEYNFKHRGNRLPYILLAVDEWSEVTFFPKIGKLANDLLFEVARKGRAAGICCMICTQYPKSSVLDSLIKVVLPGVIAFPMPNIPASVAVVGSRKAYDIGEPGRMIFQHGRIEMECQAPLITNDILEAIIADAQSGKEYTATLNERHDVSSEEIFRWSLQHNSGKLDWRSLVQQYAPRGFKKGDADKLIDDWEGRVVVVNNSEYTVTRGSRSGGVGSAARLLLYADPAAATDNGNGIEIEPTPILPETENPADPLDTAGCEHDDATPGIE